MQNTSINKTEALLLAFTFLYTVILNLSFLFSSDYAWGADGYYYAAQIRHFHDRSTFFGSNRSIGLYIMLAFSYFNQPFVVTNKIVIALTTAGLTIPAWFLGRIHNSARSGFLLAALLVSNTLVLHFVFEFSNNLMGIFFLLWFLVFLLKIIKFGFQRGTLIYCLLFLILTIFAHKLTGVLALLILCTVLLQVLPVPKKYLMGMLLILLLTPFPAILKEFLPALTPERFAGQLNVQPQFTPLSYAKVIHPGLPETIEIYIFAATLILASLLTLTARTRSKIVFTISFTFLVCLYPWLKFSEPGMAFRLFIISFIPAGILLVYYLHRFSGILHALLTLLLLLYQPMAQAGFKHQKAVAYPRYAKLVGRLRLPDDSLLIAHQGLDNYYYYKTGLDSFRYLPEASHQHRPIYRLAYGLSEKHQKQLILKRKIILTEGKYNLIKESDWQELLKSLTPSSRRSYRHWKNPYKPRPGFLQK